MANEKEIKFTVPADATDEEIDAAADRELKKYTDKTIDDMLKKNGF